MCILVTDSVIRLDSNWISRVQNRHPHEEEAQNQTNKQTSGEHTYICPNCWNTMDIILWCYKNYSNPMFKLSTRDVDWSKTQTIMSIGQLAGQPTEQPNSSDGCSKSWFNLNILASLYEIISCIICSSCTSININEELGLWLHKFMPPPSTRPPPAPSLNAANWWEEWNEENKWMNKKTRTPPPVSFALQMWTFYA